MSEFLRIVPSTLWLAVKIVVLLWTISGGVSQFIYQNF